ncbi:MAG: amylo-alpha-1,6-glucosidase [Candidatus Binataceae bacterium]
MKKHQIRRTSKPRSRIGRIPHPAPMTLKVGSEYYVLASSGPTTGENRVLADAQSFAVFDTMGDIASSPLEALGMFHRDTRFLSRFELLIDAKAPCFLNSYLSDDNAELVINLTNPHLRANAGAISVPRTSIQLERIWVLDDAALFHRITARNFSREHVSFPLDLSFGADFADLFEVRGVKRKRKGKQSAPKVTRGAVLHRYLGLDGVTRITELAFNPAPARLGGEGAAFVIALDPGESMVLETRIACSLEPPPAAFTAATAGPASNDGVAANFARALKLRRDEISLRDHKWAKLSSSDELFNRLLKASGADLSSLIGRDSAGSFMMAGIPWFATLFGRDSIITSYFLLAFNPEIAGQTLRALAAMQGTKIDDARDEQPGKIVHEVRAGEMAATGEIPFGRYYGSVDSTPLFLWLVGEHAAVTGDLTIAKELWSNVERALEWIERWGDIDGDGFVEYSRKTARGLSNQGWKDSFDSISNADGSLAKAPIALAEVQGYVFAAYTRIAEVAVRLGKADVAAKLTGRAKALKAAFATAFWVERCGMIALALDGDKRPCDVMASNGAHDLATGLVEGRHARAMCERLMAPDMFSGWGMRTLSSNERRYNPMSYHNGSVWPHDNALAAIGLGRTGDRRGVIRILERLFNAGVRLQIGSLPELICGFERNPGVGPVPYPTACHPQAWSAASVFAIVQAMLGLSISGADKRVTIESPALPSWLDWVKLENLRVGTEAVSLMMRRNDGAVAVEVLKKARSVTIEVKE